MISLSEQIPNPFKTILTSLRTYDCKYDENDSFIDIDIDIALTRKEKLTLSFNTLPNLHFHFIQNLLRISPSASLLQCNIVIMPGLEFKLAEVYKSGLALP